ncbi:MAG: hypothetical protein OMM_03992 [Candidatus Magnetoglobus multicellularis str. Araruama]|uniref:Lipoprotein n=1 Tax=Candidatus Magnetoglobus multicellularis str. Araruama TaxID=890399 RepID=A0A1V1P3A2_9BACT|nr:MAG: hypothetical protein OMM_03992 [Candidatus Magnetoglobus multicellularis str. Araruama]
MKSIKTHILILLILITTSSCVTQKCPNCENGPPYPNAHRVYRGKWYDTYDCGRYLINNECYKKAIPLFSQAIQGNPTDTRYARSYSTHFVKDYFPNREQGIAWYFLGEYEKAFTALSLSIKQFNSEKARYFLDKVNRARFKKMRISPTQPHIVFNRIHKNLMFTNECPVIISGRITDPQYVFQISIDNKQVFQDYSAREVTFNHPLYLDEGSHPIDISAQNLNGRKSSKSIIVQVDRTGPKIVIHSKRASMCDGIILDNFGLKHIQINNRIIPCQGKKKVPFHAIITNSSIDIIQAEDLAGNVTSIKHPIWHQTHYPDRQFFAENERKWKHYYSDARQARTQSIHIHIQDWQPFDYSYLPEMNIQGEIFSKHALTQLTINSNPITCDSETNLIFSKKVHLTPGQNHIEIVAIDQKGNTQQHSLSIYRYIPESQKNKHRLRLAVFPFETIPVKMDATQFSNALLDALHQQNRFNIIVRKQIHSPKSFWSILSFQSQTETADALSHGRLIKSPKDIEIYIPLVTLDSQILGYADVYIPLESQHDLKKAMTRLVNKLIYRFPLSNGVVKDFDTRHVCANWEFSNGWVL